METFIVLTFMPMKAGFHVPADVLRMADENDIRFSEGTEKGGRYLRFECRRGGNDLEMHLSKVISPIVAITSRIRDAEPSALAELGCVAYGDAQNGVHFTKEQLQLLVELNMALDIQTYATGGDKELGSRSSV